MQIGTIDEYPVYYNKKDDTVKCKDITVSAKRIIDAVTSSIDKERIQPELVLRKFDTGVSLGCFDINREKTNLLIKNLKNARVKKQN